jgi:DNA-directed RNA polymerase I subunit RPA1
MAVALLSGLQDLVDTARITTNDVGAVLAALGVEAARSTLLTEIGRVFGVYGIGVDARHLNLIADFMMHQVRRGL